MEGEWGERCGFCGRWVDGVAPEQKMEDHIESCPPAVLAWLTAKHFWEHEEAK